MVSLPCATKRAEMVSEVRIELYTTLLIVFTAHLLGALSIRQRRTLPPCSTTFRLVWNLVTVGLLGWICSDDVIIHR